MTLAVAAAIPGGAGLERQMSPVSCAAWGGNGDGIDAHDSVVRKAIRQLERVRNTLAGLGVQCREVGLDVFGAGVGVAQNGTDFVMLSVAGPADGVLNITAGLLKDISHERPKVLELCNSFTKRNPACPVYLHDAPDGWDIHMQQRFLVDVLISEPWFFRSCVEDLPVVARSARSKFHAAGICGRPYSWSEADARRLLVRSLV